MSEQRTELTTMQYWMLTVWFCLWESLQAVLQAGAAVTDTPTGFVTQAALDAATGDQAVHELSDADLIELFNLAAGAAPLPDDERNDTRDSAVLVGANGELQLSSVARRTLHDVARCCRAVHRFTRALATALHVAPAAIVIPDVNDAAALVSELRSAGVAIPGTATASMSRDAADRMLALAGLDIIFTAPAESV